MQQHEHFEIQLSKRGFGVIDAVDGSKTILDKIQQKGIYRKMIQVEATLFIAKKKPNSICIFRFFLETVKSVTVCPTTNTTLVSDESKK